MKVKWHREKSVVLLGPRQVGKTMLVKGIRAKEKAPLLFVSGEDRAVQVGLGSQSVEILCQNIGKYQLLVVNEA